MVTRLACSSADCIHYFWPTTPIRDRRADIAVTALTRPNFEAWQVDLDDPRGRPGSPTAEIARLVEFGVLAPSSHNSQPWVFVVGDDYIEIAPDYERCLPASDPDERQLYVSLGCAAEAVLQAADALGYRAQMTPLDLGDRWHLRIDLERPEVRRSVPADHMARGLVTRATNRSAHDMTPLPAAFVEAVDAADDDELSVSLLPDRSSCAAIAELVVEGSGVVMKDRGFRRELADYMIPNNSRRFVGMPGDTMGLGLITSAVVPPILRVISPPKQRAEHDRVLLGEKTTAFVVVASSTDGPPGWAAGGRMYMRLALVAERLGVSTNNHAASSGHASSRTALAHIAGTDKTPTICFRVGCATKAVPHAPRLPAKQVTVYGPQEST